MTGTDRLACLAVLGTMVLGCGSRDALPVSGAAGVGSAGSASGGSSGANASGGAGAGGSSDPSSSGGTAADDPCAVGRARYDQLRAQFLAKSGVSLCKADSDCSIIVNRPGFSRDSIT